MPNAAEDIVCDVLPIVLIVGGFGGASMRQNGYPLATKEARAIDHES